MPLYTAASLPLSLKRQEALFESSLILNPVENLPPPWILRPASGFLHGLYNTDKVRSAPERIATRHQFAGRNRQGFDARAIYTEWAKLLGAEDLSMRLLSGLHSHIVIFMGLGSIGDSVLLLPELAGGHMSTKAILDRLGFRIIEMAVDLENHCVDVLETRKLIAAHRPRFIFVDRSEGLNYEDFSSLLEPIDDVRPYTVFDTSQYLSNVIAGDFPHPFAMGFDLAISTIHKNFPGPQKAIVFTRKCDARWEQLLKAISMYVSNMHNFNTYSAGFMLSYRQLLGFYSRAMLQNACQLESALRREGLAVVQRKSALPPTHHIWIKADSPEQAFSMFRNLERVRLFVNYRYLPYGLGYGLRLGTAAATISGLHSEHIGDLSRLIACVSHGDNSARTRHRVRDLIRAIKARPLWKRPASPA